MDNELEDTKEIKLYIKDIITIFLMSIIIMALIIQFRYIKKYKQYFDKYNQINNEYNQSLDNIKSLQLNYEETKKECEKLKITLDEIKNNNYKLTEENNMLNWYIGTYGIVNGNWQDFKKDINNGG